MGKSKLFQGLGIGSHSLKALGKLVLGSLLKVLGNLVLDIPQL